MHFDTVKCLRSLSFKIAIVIVIVASLAILLSYVALGGLNSSKTDYQQNSAVTIRVETDKPSYTLGETVKTKCYLINRKNEIVKIEHSATIFYDVFNSKGEPITGRVDFLTLHPDYPIVLPPQSETLFPFEAFEWDQKFRPDPSSSFTDVSAGTYTIKVVVESRSRVISSETTIEIKRPPMLWWAFIIIIVGILVITGALYGLRRRY